jgi:iron-sulfur cluster assembly accessory protein
VYFSRNRYAILKTLCGTRLAPSKAESHPDSVDPGEGMKLEITVTDLAARKIREALAAASEKGQGLRVQVTGRGAAGFRCKFALDVEREGDRAFEKNEARVFIEPRSLLYINGATLDYREGSIESGFVLAEPHRQSRCACGAGVPLYEEAPDLPEIW